MFKLIGIIVFIIVLVVGYPALSRWYSGDATPKEAVDEIRGNLSDKLATDKNGDRKKTSSDKLDSDSSEREQVTENRKKSKDKDAADTPPKELTNLDMVINEVTKK